MVWRKKTLGFEEQENAGEEKSSMDIELDTVYGVIRCVLPLSFDWEIGERLSRDDSVWDEKSVPPKNKRKSSACKNDPMWNQAMDDQYSSTGKDHHVRKSWMGTNGHRHCDYVSNSVICIHCVVF